MIGNEQFDALQGVNAALFVPAKYNKVVNVAAVQPGAKVALDEVIQRVHVDQRIHLRQQVANGYAHRLAIIGKLHHHVNEPPILDLSLDQLAQDAAVDAVEELANIKLQQV